jgi:flagellar hook-associated protein 2
MTAAISSLGVGSGLDLSSLLASLQTEENGELTPITNKQTTENTILTAYGTLSASLYNTPTASTNTAFSATVGTGASNGSYSIDISQLAQAQSLVSTQTVSSTTTQLGTTGASDRSLSIQVGSGKAVNISLSDSQTTLSGLIGAINSANAGVTASYVQTGDSGYQLVVTSNTSGASSNINMSVTGDSALDFLDYNSNAGTSATSSTVAGTGTSTSSSSSTTGMTQTVAGQDATLTVNGVFVDQSSNTISNVPQGVTLTLNATTPTAQNLVLSQNESNAETAINTWVNAYNSLQSTFTSLGQYTAVGVGQAQSSSNGPLLGDSVLDTAESQIGSALSAAQSSSTFQVLSQLGITQNTTTGMLTVNSTTLEQSLNNNPAQVQAFFVGNGTTTGLATQMNNIANNLTSSNGVISGAEAGVNSVLSDLTTQYNQVQSSITSTMNNYQTEFEQLDVLMSQLSSTSSFLSQQFGTSTSSVGSTSSSSSSSSSSS